MQKWEYLYVELHGVVVEQVNEEQIAPEGISQFLKRVGEAGWEAVGITDASETAVSWRLILKRPKQG
jgi:hypothetical protein